MFGAGSILGPDATRFHRVDARRSLAGSIQGTGTLLLVVLSIDPMGEKQERKKGEEYSTNGHGRFMDLEPSNM
jgi:hypothetical protein